MAGDGRDVAVVLSGGGMNGMLMEVGFLKRLRASSLWPRVGWFFGTSSGALSSCMAALDRLPALEDFLLGLRAEETFRPNRLWRLPLLGTHDYALPATIEARLGDPVEFARELAAAPAEVVVLVTDVTGDGATGEERRPFERAYSSRATAPDEMAQAVLASAAISMLVLPRQVGDRIGTDGGWVRNFPLGYAYERPEVGQIVAFRYEPRYPSLGAGVLQAPIRRLRRWSKLPAARALLVELERATERGARGEPVHVVDTFARLSRVAIQRNTILEELLADDRDRSISELQSLREDVLALIPDGAARAAVEARFDEARFPFSHNRVVPRLTVSGTAGAVSLEPGFRHQKPWSPAVKRVLIDRGFALADRELAAHGVA